MKEIVVSKPVKYAIGAGCVIGSIILMWIGIGVFTGTTKIETSK